MATAGTSEHVAGIHATALHPQRVSIHEALQMELQTLFARHEHIKPLFVELANLLVKHAAATFVSFAQLTNGDEITSLVSLGKLTESKDDPVWQAYQAACHSALTKHNVFVGRLPQDGRTWIVAAPIFTPGSQPFALAAVVTSVENDFGQTLSLVEHVAGSTAHWRTAQVLARMDWEARASSAAVELMSRIERIDTTQAACYLAVDELAKLFQCERVAIAMTDRRGLATKLSAISGMSSFDTSSESIVAIKNALDEVLVRNDATSWPPLESKDRHATLAHRKLAELTKTEAILSAPLTPVDEQPVGALLLMGRRSVLHRPPQIHALNAVAPHLATALLTRTELEPSRIKKIWRETFGKNSTGHRRAIWSVAIAACLLVPLCPWPHKLRQKCTVEPVVRRYLVAPYDGILQTSFARPGDIVAAEQPLARMDDRELRWELSSTIAERGRAAKQRDVAMAENDTSEMQLAAIEMDRLDLKIKLLKHREGTLEISSPIAGVVLRGDLKDAEGAPVKTGQSLFEVAPLEKVKLELSIVEEELPYVSVGMNVTARLDGCVESKVSGTVSKVFPRSEMRNNTNVFIAEVELENPNQTLRPGMNGQAKIHSGVRPLGWIWLHKAWHRVRNWVG